MAKCRRRTRPILLDLFCGAGGCSVGYHRAGFDVIGIDHLPQRRYPFEFILGDALEYLRNQDLSRFSAIHASPPCQLFSLATFVRGAKRGQHQDLLRPTLLLLAQRASSNQVWVVENVASAPVPSHGFTLCGLMFGLRLFRHRRFACSHLLWAPEHPSHRGLKVGEGGMVCMCGHGDASRKHRKSVPPDHRGVGAWKKASGIDWMTRDEMAQAIPPAYTEYIGRQLLTVLRNLGLGRGRHA